MSNVLPRHAVVFSFGRHLNFSRGDRSVLVQNSINDYELYAFSFYDDLGQQGNGEGDVEAASTI